jgi:hypothetical protein
MRLTGRNAPYILEAAMALAVAATPTLAAPARSADETPVQAVTE